MYSYKAESSISYYFRIHTADGIYVREIDAKHIRDRLWKTRARNAHQK